MSTDVPNSLNERLLAYLDVGVSPVTAEEVISACASSASDAKARGRYRRSPRMKSYAFGAAAMAAAICVLVVVLVVGLPSSSKPTVVAPARPSFVPASWQRVTFGGLTMYAPGSWPVIPEQSWGDCGITLQPLVKDDAVELNTGTNAETFQCPSIVTNAHPQPINGFLVDPGPYGPLDDANGFGPCMNVNSLSACPATTEDNAVLLLAVHVPGIARPVAVEIDVVLTSVEFEGGPPLRVLL